MQKGYLYFLRPSKKGSKEHDPNSGGIQHLSIKIYQESNIFFYILVENFFPRRMRLFSMHSRWVWMGLRTITVFLGYRKMTRIFFSVDRISKPIWYSWSAQPVLSSGIYFAWNRDKKFPMMSGGYPRVEKMTHRKVQNGSVQNAQNLTLILGQIELGSHFVTSQHHKPPHILSKINTYSLVHLRRPKNEKNYRNIF